MQLTRTAAVIGLLAGAFLAGHATADKALTLKSLVLTDIVGLGVERTATGWNAVARYGIRESGGAVVKQGAVAVTLNAGQIASIETFIANNMLPAANTQEGL